MKLEIDFAVQIMEAMESSDTAIVERGCQILEGLSVTDQRYRYHCLMLSEAGLIRLWPCVNYPEVTASGYYYIDTDNAIIEEYDDQESHAILAHPLMLTYEGHKFLEMMRDEGVKSTVRKFLAEQGLPFVFSMVKEVGLKAFTG